MRRFLPFAISFCSVFVIAELPVNVDLLFVGTYRRGAIEASSGETWFGVYSTGDGFRLLRSKILVEQLRHDNPDLPFTVRVTADQQRVPVFLVKGIPGLSDRPIPTIFSGKFFLPPFQTSILQLTDSIRYGFQAKGTYREVAGAQGLYDYELEFFQFPWKRSQMLATFRQIDLENPPSILWAGDLDNDGKLDFILELANHSGATQKTLYLSSMAKGNDFVAEAAEFSHPDC